MVGVGKLWLDCGGMVGYEERGKLVVMVATSLMTCMQFGAT